jgi:hypothetical protein
MASWIRGWTIAAGLFAWLTALPAYSEEQSCPETDARLSLPKGFCATIFADEIGHARQLAVAPDGTVYVNTWSGIIMATTGRMAVDSSSRSRTRRAPAMLT